MSTVCTSMEDRDLVFQKKGHPQSPTHSRPAECGSRHAIQARPGHPGWSLLPEFFPSICSRWHWPQIDLFATGFNNKLPLFVSPVPDPLAWAWEDLDTYAFSPVAILEKVVANLQDYP